MRARCPAYPVAFLSHGVRLPVQEADRLIAKALQDQERAFMLLNGFGG